MFFWIYEIPPLLAIAAFGLAFVSVCWLGIFVSRTFVKSRFHQQPGLNGILGDYLQYFGVIYGLLLGLLAVGTYQNHAEAEKAVSKEASALAGLYRDVRISGAIRDRAQDAHPRLHTLDHRGRVAGAA